MAEPHTPLDDRLTTVECELADLTRRVLAIERGHAAAAASPARIAPAPEPGLLAVPRVDVARTSKLLFEDFRVSPPSLLFAALALYGASLIVAPRLAKRESPDPRDLISEADLSEGSYPSESRFHSRVDINDFEK